MAPFALFGVLRGFSFVRFAALREKNNIMTNELKNWKITGLIATIVIVLSVPLYLLKVTYIHDPLSEGGPAVFVGREKCKDCHQAAYDKWTDSHHDKAMDVANEDTVLGDFDNAVFDQGGISTRFYRKGKTFFVHTQGPDGKMGDFEITHTFGTYPLQQYLVPFPGGRLQCLTIAWDVVKKKWYLLPNHTNDAGDWLHWTKAGQNWNGMCAECHSTHLKKGYDYKTDTFNTTWAEIDVSCEACHGPGSRHVEWADMPAMARTETANYELVVKTRDMSPREQLELCARCHARRAVLGDYDHTENDPMDHMIPRLIDDGFYYPDGQVLEEVYVYGSFIQSKMYQREISCSDCHDIHSLKPLKDGNDLCLQCHRADIYDTKNHHFHKKMYKGQPSDGDDCIKCHMPGRDYMGIDNRADHSIRVPRPDLSIRHNTPNSCNMTACHDDKSHEWSADYITKWYGIKKKPHYGSVIAAGRERRPNALTDLIKLADDQLFPPVVRSTALSLLRTYPGRDTLQALERALSDGEALVRHTAISTLNLLNHARKVELIVPLLYDPVKAVRIQAALALTAEPSKKLTANQESAFRSALREYQMAMEYSADFPSSRYNLGIMYANLGKNDLAEKNYKAAIRIDDRFYPAKNNLALLYNQLGKNNEARTLLREIIKTHPELYEVAYSLGLLLAEMNRLEEAAEYMKRAAEGMPNYPRIHYNLGLLQQKLRRIPEAEASLLSALRNEPDNIDFLYALADHYIKRGRLERARRIAEHMVSKHPSSRIGRDIFDFIDRKTKATN